MLTERIGHCTRPRTPPTAAQRPRRTARARHTGGPQAGRPTDAPGRPTRRDAAAGLRGDDPARRHQRPAPDLVKRQFTAAGPNQLWVADMTYVPTWAGFIYLAVVLDVWSRRIVGWAIGEHMTTDLVLAALNMAITQRKPDGVIHHSDQGSQYTRVAFGKRCGRWACARRWAASATPTTTPWRKASSPAWSANCSTGAASRPRPRLDSPYSRTSRAGTTPGDAIPGSGAFRRPNSSAATLLEQPPSQRRREPLNPLENQAITCPPNRGNSRAPPTIGARCSSK